MSELLTDTRNRTTVDFVAVRLSRCAQKNKKRGDRDEDEDAGVAGVDAWRPLRSSPRNHLHVVHRQDGRQSELQLSQGQSFQVNYQVSVARDPDFDFDGDNTANVL